MKDGLGIDEVCAKLEICDRTYRRWLKKYPEFNDAHMEGQTYARAWWAAKGRLGIDEGNRFNDRAYAFQVKNHFPYYYAEKGRRKQFTLLLEALNNDENTI